MNKPSAFIRMTKVFGGLQEQLFQGMFKLDLKRVHPSLPVLKAVSDAHK